MGFYSQCLGLGSLHCSWLDHFLSPLPAIIGKGQLGRTWAPTPVFIARNLDLLNINTPSTNAGAACSFCNFVTWVLSKWKVWMRALVRQVYHEHVGYLFLLCCFIFCIQFKRRVQESTQVLRELEISLRTNHIGLVPEAKAILLAYLLLSHPPSSSCAIGNSPPLIWRASRISDHLSITFELII